MNTTQAEFFVMQANNNTVKVTFVTRDENGNWVSQYEQSWMRGWDISEIGNQTLIDEIEAIWSGM